MMVSVHYNFNLLTLGRIQIKFPSERLPIEYLTQLDYSQMCGTVYVEYSDQHISFWAKLVENLVSQPHITKVDLPYKWNWLLHPTRLACRWDLEPIPLHRIRYDESNLAFITQWVTKHADIHWTLECDSDLPQIAFETWSSLDVTWKIHHIAQWVPPSSFTNCAVIYHFPLDISKRNYKEQINHLKHCRVISIHALHLKHFEEWESIFDGWTHLETLHFQRKDEKQPAPCFVDYLQRTQISINGCFYSNHAAVSFSKSTLDMPPHMLIPEQPLSLLSLNTLLHINIDGSTLLIDQFPLDVKLISKFLKQLPDLIQVTLDLDFRELKRTHEYHQVEYHLREWSEFLKELPKQIRYVQFGGTFHSLSLELRYIIPAVTASGCSFHVVNPWSALWGSETPVVTFGPSKALPPAEVEAIRDYLVLTNRILTLDCTLDNPPTWSPLLPYCSLTEVSLKSIHKSQYPLVWQLEWKGIGNDKLESILPKMTNLVQLAWNKPSLDWFSRLIPLCAHLHTITLSGIPQEHRNEVGNILRACPLLKRVNLPNDAWYFNEWLPPKLEIYTQAMSRVAPLHLLMKTQSVHTILATSVSEWMKYQLHLPNLTSLTLVDSRNFLRDNMGALLTMLKSLPGLTHLNCHATEEPELVAYLQNNHHLQQLKLPYVKTKLCRRVTTRNRTLLKWVESDH